MRNTIKRHGDYVSRTMGRISLYYVVVVNGNTCVKACRLYSVCKCVSAHRNGAAQPAGELVSMRLVASTVTPEAGRQSRSETLPLSQFIHVTLSAVQERRCPQNGGGARGQPGAGVGERRRAALGWALRPAWPQRDAIRAAP